MIALLPPQHSIKAKLSIGGSKSISNRLLILDHIFKTAHTFGNLSLSEDTLLLQSALALVKQGKGSTIDIHHAGTDMRFLTALLCITEGSWTLTGSERMKQRPVGELVNALKILGADIAYLEKENFPPLKINGKPLQGGTLTIDGSISSQFISALLLISPAFKNGMELILKNNVVSRPYIDMTVALLKQFNVEISASENTIKVSPALSRVEAPSSAFHLPSSIFSVESDWSSASYWYSICALSQHAELELSSFSAKSLQADSVLPKLYEELGVATVFKNSTICLKHKSSTVKTFCYDFTACPDIAQTVAVTCAGLGIEATLTGLQTLKLKETDRIAALKHELEKTGATVSVTGDSLHLIPGIDKSLVMPQFATYNDHRMAMSLAPLALVYNSMAIEDQQVVDKSYPGFWNDLKSLGFNVHLQP